jgi:NhaP-type Na+/H+ or K+/H+ antiporter
MNNRNPGEITNNLVSGEEKSNILGKIIKSIFNFIFRKYIFIIIAITIGILLSGAWYLIPILVYVICIVIAIKIVGSWVMKNYKKIKISRNTKPDENNTGLYRIDIVDKN